MAWRDNLQLINQIFYTCDELRRKISIIHECKPGSIFVDCRKAEENS